MPTIVDSLIVRLGLDSKPLNSQAPAGTRKLKDLEGQAAKTEKTFGSLTAALTGFLAVLGGTAALKAFVTDTIASNAALERFSQNVGVSIESISALGNATEIAGGKSEDLQGTLASLSKAQTELALTGNSSIVPFLSLLGVSVGGFMQQAKPMEAFLLDFADGLQRVAAIRGRAFANNTGLMAGFNQGTVNLLLRGRKEIELLVARQKEFNVVTKAQGEEAVKLDQKMTGLRQTFEAVGRNLLYEASPALEKFLSAVTSLGNWIKANVEFIKDLGTVLGVVGTGLAAIAILSSPITLTVAAVTALATAIALLWQDYQVWKRGGDSLIDWTKWEIGINAAREGVKGLRDDIKRAFSNISDYAEAAQKALHGDWKGAVTALHRSDAMNADAFKNGSSSVNAVRAAIANPAPSSASLAIADKARLEAARVSAKTGIPADIVWAQWKQETGNFTNRGATSLNNLAGVNIPGGKGQDYRKFKSLDEFGDYYSFLMRTDGNYPDASKAKTPADFALALKNGKYPYYQGSEDVYAKNMTSFAAQFGGISGASQAVAAAGTTPAANGASVTNSIGEVKVYTQATDAQGIAADMGKALDYLFTSQANTGLPY